MEDKYPFETIAEQLEWEKKNSSHLGLYGEFRGILSREGNLLYKKFWDDHEEWSALTKEGKEPKNESLRDTFIDMANYAIMAVQLIDMNETSDKFSQFLKTEEIQSISKRDGENAGLIRLQ